MRLEVYAGQCVIDDPSDMTTLQKLLLKGWRTAAVGIGTLTLFPLALIMRIARPMVLFMVGSLRSNIIGHYVFDLDYHLASARGKKVRSCDLFFLDYDHSANLKWEKMVRRTVRVRQWYKYLWLASFWAPGGDGNRITFASNSRDRLGILQKTRPQFVFSSDEDRAGLDYLTRLGMSPEDEYVCLIVRDAEYKLAENRALGREKDWSYHDYRNSEIDDYDKAIDELINAGYWIFRMGKNVKTDLVHENAKVIDYANTAQRCDFLDIWLTANCRFCVSTCAGLDEVARAYRRPVVYVNFLPLRNIVTYTPSVNAPKRLFWEASGKELTQSEHLKSSYLSSQEYKKNGIVIRDLDPEEIRQTVREMIQREKGTWTDKKDNVDRQTQFWGFMKASSSWSEYHGVVDPNVYLSDFFIKKNIGWLR